MLNNHRLIRNTTIYALGDIIPKIVGFIVFPILTQYLTLADTGLVEYVNKINILLAIIGFLSLNTYYLVHYYREKSEIDQKKLLGNLSIFIMAMNLAIALVLFTVGAPIFGALGSNIDFWPYIALGVGTAFFSSFSILPSALYRLRERPTLLTVLNIAKSLFQLGLTLVLVVEYHYTALGVLWANFMAAAIFGIVFAVITFKNSILIFSWPQIRTALKFSLPLLPGSIAYFLITGSDSILIERYLSPNDLGIYGTAAKIATLLSLVSYGAYRAFEPHFFREFGRPDFERMFKKVRNSFLVLLLFMILGLGMFAREFFELFTETSYIVAYYYVPMMMVGLFASSMSMLYNTIVTARGRTKIISMITILGGAVSVGLNILLLPVLGLAGACLVSGFVFMATLLASIRYAALKEVDHLRPVCAVLVAASALWVGVYLFGDYSFWVRSSIKVTLFVLANISILAILGQSPRKLLLTLRTKKLA